MRFKAAIPILLVLTLRPPCAYAGGPLPERTVRPDDAALRDRMATAHLVRGDPMQVIAISGATGDASAADHYNLGMAFSFTGRFNRASEAFKSAFSTSEPGSETSLKAVEQFLRLSDFSPGLELPQLQTRQSEVLQPENSLYLSGYLAQRGKNEEALAILEGTDFKDADRKVISGIMTASHLAARGQWDASMRLMGRTRSSESSSLTDLLYLTRGYHYLEGGEPERARGSFTAIPPASPYSSEALLGKAWSLIRTGDLQGATIVLEELVDLHPYSHAAGDGVLDLALSYRELGLYEKAGLVLDHHRRRLTEVRRWLLGLRRTDLQTGTDHIRLLENALEGTGTDLERLRQTPYFVRQWIMDISADPYVRHTTALLKGLELAAEKAVKLGERFGRDRQLVRREVKWTGDDISRVRGTMARLEELSNRLESIKGNMAATLQSRSLGGFASERAKLLISRTGELKVRLTLVENSVNKAEGFASIVDRLSGSVTVSEEESQLNRIRKQAYDGLISSRVTLRRLRNFLTALEGRLWLEVKGGAIQLERKTSLRVTSGRTRAGQALADSSKTLRILNDRQQALKVLEQLIDERKGELETSFPGKLAALRLKIDGMRAARLLDLAARAAQEIQEAQARVLYTSADIEISRMQSTVRSLQEAVQ